MENEKYYDNKPENGGKRISFYDAFNVNGMLDPPIHHAELLKIRLQKLFDKRLGIFIEDNEMNLVEIKEEDKNQCYLLCLKDELQEINLWLSNTKSNGQETEIKINDAERVQILKYQTFIKEKIKVISPPANELSQRQEHFSPKIFQPKPGLDKVVFKDFVSQFGEIEKELISRKFMSDKYQWNGRRGNKKIFCQFLVVILSYGFTDKKVSDDNVKYIFSKRYGKPKTYLSAMFKISKRPKFEDGIITFPFISAPQEKKEVASHHPKGMIL